MHFCATPSINCNKIFSELDLNFLEHLSHVKILRIVQENYFPNISCHHHIKKELNM